MSKKILLIAGGKGDENKVSLSSAATVKKALISLGHHVIEIDAKEDDLIAKIKESDFDIVFNALHGEFGEDGTLPAILDSLAIKYTHSGVKASALAFDKNICKILAEHIGMKIAKSVLFRPKQGLTSEVLELTSTAFIVKPVADGSSCNMLIVKEPENFAVSDLLKLEEREYLIEEYIPGREISVAILADEILGNIEIVVNGQEFYNYEAKYQSKRNNYIVPADFPEDLLNEISHKTLDLHKLLGCNSISRSDFIYYEGDFYFLELNTHPGLTESSLVPKIAKANAITIENMVEILLTNS